MAGRIRTLKPEWLEDEKLSMASIEARLLSVALLLIADDHGRGRAHPARLGLTVFLADSDGTETARRALAELEAIGYARTYTVRDQAYFEVVNWKKHQKVDKPSAPRVPAPGDASNENTGDSPVARPSRDARETLGPSSRDPRETLATDPDLRPPISDPISPTPDPREGGAGGSVSMDETEIQSRLLSSPAFRGVDVVGAAASIAQHCALKGIRHPRILQVLPWALSQLEDAMMRPDPPKNPATYVRAIVLRYGPPGCYERRDDGQHRRAPPVPAATAQTGGKLPVYEAAPGLSADEKRDQAAKLREAMQRIGKGGTAA